MTAVQQANENQTGKSGMPPWPLSDEDGFLLHPQTWSPSFAETQAAIEGIDSLSETHWSVIHFLRAYYESFGGMPSIRRVCRSQRLSKHNVSEMFNSCLSAWKIAGLPNPGEEAKAYMS